MEHFKRFYFRISGTSSPWETALSQRVKVCSLSSAGINRNHLELYLSCSKDSDSNRHHHSSMHVDDVAFVTAPWLDVTTCTDEHRKLPSARNYHVKEKEVIWSILSITWEIFEQVLFSCDCWLFDLYENKTCSKISPNTVASCAIRSPTLSFARSHSASKT